MTVAAGLAKKLPVNRPPDGLMVSAMELLLAPPTVTVLSSAMERVVDGGGKKSGSQSHSSALRESSDFEGLYTPITKIDRFLPSIPIRLTMLYPDQSSISYAYEPCTSRLQSTTDAKTQQTTYAYNVDNTMASVAYTGTSSLSDLRGVVIMRAWPPAL